MSGSENRVVGENIGALVRREIECGEPTGWHWVGRPYLYTHMVRHHPVPPDNERCSGSLRKADSSELLAEAPDQGCDPTVPPSHPRYPRIHHPASLYRWRAALAALMTGQGCHEGTQRSAEAAEIRKHGVPLNASIVSACLESPDDHSVTRHPSPRPQANARFRSCLV